MVSQSGDLRRHRAHCDVTVMWDLNFLITLSAAALAPNGTRPSAGTAMTSELCMVYIEIHRQSLFQNNHFD